MGFFIAGAEYMNKTLNQSGQVTYTRGMQISADGFKFYIFNSADNYIYQYNLTTAYDISTGSYASKRFLLNVQDTNPYAFFIRYDGKRMWALGRTNDRVYQYTLGTAWDISTVSYDSVSFSFVAQDGAAKDIKFSADGTKMYIVGTNNQKVFQYTLTTAWDISTAAYASKSKSLTETTLADPTIALSFDGNYMIVTGEFDRSFGSYNLSTPWDISTAQFITLSPFIPSDAASMTTFCVSGNNLRLYSGANNTGLVYQYDISSLYERTKRNVSASLSVSWKKNYLNTIRFFTIGVSTIGGNDLINSSDSIDSRWNKYQYTDESAYITEMEWEQGLNLPAGGISKGLAAGKLDNNSHRFTPRYMGGNSELYTAVLPSRPFIMNAGFTKDGVDYQYPAFVGLFNRQPRIDNRSKTLEFTGEDFIGFLQSRYVDNTIMYTGQRSDQLIGNILAQQGFSTSQYDLDTGINRIPFAVFNRGDRYGDIIDRIAKAEYAQFYQDERGVLKFENRQHWDSSPYNAIQYILNTSQVVGAESPSDDHIINVVEIKSKILAKQPEQTIFRLVTTDAIEVPASSTKEIFVDFSDPVLSVTTPTSTSTTSYFKAFTAADGTGTNVSTSLSITSAYAFANSAKFVFRNSTTASAYITELVITGRPAKVEREIYLRSKDDSSVTAYQERSLTIENDYIQEESWASSLAQLILTDFSAPENLQTITIKAIPQLKLGDLVSWQGRYWRVFDKKTTLSPSDGFLQELQLLQRTITTYFRIGISTIGGSDRIAP